MLQLPSVSMGMGDVLCCVPRRKGSEQLALQVLDLIRAGQRLAAD
jgi:hypothetical protein